MSAWERLDPHGRANLYDEALASLQRRYPGIRPALPVDYYSPYEPLFESVDGALYRMDGSRYQPLDVEITEGTLVYPVWRYLLFGLLAVLGIGIITG